MTRLALVLGLVCCACPRSGPDPEDEARALQVDLHRALIITRSMGRFGELGLFEQAMDLVPCAVPISETNRQCDAALQGKGPVRMRVADLDLQQTGHLRKDALVWVEYQPDCEGAKFDFKTMDNALPRGATMDGVTLWQNALVRVTHRRLPWTPKDKCTLTIEAAPSLLARVKSVPPQLP